MRLGAVGPRRPPRPALPSSLCPNGLSRELVLSLSTPFRPAAVLDRADAKVVIRKRPPEASRLPCHKAATLSAGPVVGNRAKLRGRRVVVGAAAAVAAVRRRAFSVRLGRPNAALQTPRAAEGRRPDEVRLRSPSVGHHAALLPYAAEGAAPVAEGNGRHNRLLAVSGGLT